MCGAVGVFAEEGVFEGVAVGNMTMWCAVEGIGILVRKASGYEEVELVGGVRRWVEEGSKIEWYVAEGSATRGDVGFLDKGDGAEAGTATGTQFGCCRIGCPWVAFIDSWGRRL